MDGHLPFLGVSPANLRMVTHQPKVAHPAWPGLTPFGPGCPCLASFGNVWSRLAPMDPVWPCLALFGPVRPRLVPVNICPCFVPFGTVFPIWLHLAWSGLFDPIYTLVKKLTLGDNCHGWTPTITIQRMVPHPPKDGHPPT